MQFMYVMHLRLPQRLHLEIGKAIVEEVYKTV